MSLLFGPELPRRLIIRHDPATELVAKSIAKLAQSGVLDIDTPLKRTLQEFNPHE
jgi:hypothetical protein